MIILLSCITAQTIKKLLGYQLVHFKKKSLCLGPEPTFFFFFEVGLSISFKRSVVLHGLQHKMIQVDSKNTRTKLLYTRIKNEGIKNSSFYN